METEAWLFREETSGAEGKETKDDTLRNKELNQFINYRRLKTFSFNDIATRKQTISSFNIIYQNPRLQMQAKCQGLGSGLLEMTLPVLVSL